MEIVIDSEVCQGHARCYAVAPLVVELDDMGHSHVRPDSGPVEPDVARKLIASCPEKAISIIEDATNP